MIFTGKFSFPSVGEVRGSLTLDGTERSLYVWSESNYFIPTWHEEMGRNVGTIKGTLDDQNEVSLISCLARGSGIRSIREKFIHTAGFFLSYAVLGRQHISHEEETVTEVRFVIEDESVLFYDPDVFGVNIRPPHSLVEQAVRHQRDGVGEIKAGAFSYIGYHIGRKQIFEADTVCGKISAFHNPVLNLAGDHLSAEIGTKVFITLKFPSPTILEEAVERTFRVQRFFELLIGCSQNLVEFLIYKECGHEEPEILEVHGRDFPKHEPSENKPKKHPMDVLIRAVQNPEEFPRVLENWLRKEEDEGWRRARNRFFSFFETQNSYDLDGSSDEISPCLR